MARDCRRRLRGAREVGFTVLSMSLSLIAVFMPILLMGGIVGRLFREFAMTLSVAILISLVVSLTTTPMMCARILLPRTAEDGAGPLPRRRVAAPSTRCCDGYERSLRWALRIRLIVMVILVRDRRASTSICSSTVPKGFFPQQDTGR